MGTSSQNSLIQIGPVQINSRVMLAPMAGVTDVVFRSLVRRWAPESLICTEMISSNGLVHAKKSKKYTPASILDKTAQDSPIAYQLAAHQKEVLIEAALSILAEQNPDTIDLNMGCPVKKITGNFEGCALMKAPDVAYELISSLVEALKPYNKPVTVKFRLGWDANSMNYLSFGQLCQDAGAQMVTLHARTRAQGYQPGCKWEAFGELKAQLKIPVIANGDINTLADAQHVLETYGVDGVMLGRGCQGEPWLIGQIDQALKNQALKNQALKTDQPSEAFSLPERLAVALAHARLQCLYQGPQQGIREIRKHLAWYLKGFHGASGYRAQVMQVQSVEEIEQIFKQILTDAQLPAEAITRHDNILLDAVLNEAVCSAG